MQLLSIRKQGADVTYEVGIYSEEVAFFREINDRLLCNTAGVSGFNHSYNAATVSGTWLGTLGSGYVYGFIDGFGYTDANAPAFNAFVNALLVPYFTLTPSFYVKQLVDLIFAESGYTYESAFFNSERFKRLVLPYAGGATIQSDFSGSNSFAKADDVISWEFAAYIPPPPAAPLNEVYFGVVNFNSKTDPPNFWDLPRYTNPNIYRIFDFQINLDIQNLRGIQIDFEVVWWDVTNNRQFGDKFSDSLAPSEERTFTYSGQRRFNPNAEYEVRIYYVVPTEFESPTEVLNFVKNKIECQMICVLDVPDSVDMVTALPMDITQADLLADLQKMFNLYFYIRPEDPQKIYIEPFNNWYASGSVDWTQKIDEGAEQMMLTGDPESRKSITFKYRDAGDALSKTYNEVFADGYGSREYQTDNYYATGEQTIETKCATVIPATYGRGLVIGRTFDVNANGTIKTRPNGYRIAQYRLIDQREIWLYLVDAEPTLAAVASLPYIGHIDDPYDAQFDLAFGMPKQLYYKVFNNSTIVPYTNNNLFNIYWKTYIEETTSKEALTIELTAMLDAADIATLDFRVPIYYKGIKWRLLKIEGYQVGGSRPCRVTLRRILNLSQPTTGAVSVLNYFDVQNLVLGEMRPQLADPTQLTQSEDSSIIQP